MQPSPATTNKDASEFTIERLSKERLKDVESIYEAVYYKKPVANYFPIKYNTAYTGAEYVGYVAYDRDNTPVGYYGVIPCFLELENKKILAAQSADTMTHPAFRKKGMFVTLANMTFELCKTIGIQTIFGFPNQHSLHGFLNNLKWEMKDSMSAFMIPVNAFPLARWCQKLRMTKTLYSRYVNVLLKKSTLPMQIIANSSIADEFGGVVRDKSFEISKSYHNRKVLKFENSIVWCKITNELIIGDLEVEPESFPKLMKELKMVAFRLGLTRIQFHSSTGTTLYALFSMQYPSVPSYPVIFLDLNSGIELDKFKFTLADVDIF